MKIIKSKELSSYNNPRFVVIDETTGEILDNAQGYGYKSAQKAYAAYRYRHRSAEEIERTSCEKTCEKVV